jgi:hypothetical protein
LLLLLLVAECREPVEPHPTRCPVINHSQPLPQHLCQNLVTTLTGPRRLGRKLACIEGGGWGVEMCALGGGEGCHPGPGTDHQPLNRRFFTANRQQRDSSVLCTLPSLTCVDEALHLCQLHAG